MTLLHHTKLLCLTVAALRLLHNYLFVCHGYRHGLQTDRRDAAKFPFYVFIRIGS
jgi:hypothetical protein